MKSSLKSASCTIATLGIVMSGVCVYASALKMPSMRVSRESEVRLPAAPVGPDSAKYPFRESSMLKGLPLLSALQSQDFTTVVSDTAGLMQFPKAARDGVLRSGVATVRPEGFTKGKLRLRSNVRARMLLDGKVVAESETADSLPSDHDYAVSLEPQKAGLIQVDILSLSGDPAAPSVGVEYIPDSEFDSVPVLLGPDVKPRFSLETTAIGQRVYDVKMSPDGKYLLLICSYTKDGKNYDYTYEVRDAATDKVVYESESAVDWMPKGSTLYFTRSSVKKGGYDLFTLELSRQVPKFVCNVPDRGLIMAPSGEYALYYASREGKKETGPMIRISEPDDRLPDSRKAYHLMKVDLKSGLTSPVTAGGPTTYICDISPDSRRLLYISTRTTPGKFPFYHTSLVEVDMESLRTDTIAAGEGESGISAAVYSPEGSRLFIEAGPEAFGGIGRNAGKFEYANEFDIQGYVFDLKSREAKAVTRDFNPSLQTNPGPVWNAADGMVYFMAEEGFDRPVYSFDPKKGTFRRLPLSIENVRNFSIGNDESRWLAASGMGYSYAGRTEMLDLKSGRARVVLEPTREEMASLALGSEQPWSFTAKDGSLIEGMMILPPDFDAAKKYPLIVYYYGGTAPSQKGMTNPYTPHLFASRDYVVYVLNPSGTTGYGQEFSSRHVNAWGDYTADEIIEGVKKFCKDHPFVDEKKIGCLGASYGGFMTQLLLTKTDIFAAAVSHAGISNVASYWGEGYWGYSYNAVAAAKSYPWDNPELFTSHGSLFNADKIHTPLLLLHGNADTNVPVGESIQLFNALSILGRQVELIEVDGENHFIADFEKRRLWHASIMAWFARFLKDDPSWWNSLYPE